MFCKTKNCVLFKLQKWWWDKKIANLCLKKVESVKKGEKEKFGMNLSAQWPWHPIKVIAYLV